MDRFKMLGVVLTSLILAACSSLLSQPTSEPTNTPAPTEAPIQATSDSSTAAPSFNLYITNNGTITICYLYIVESAAEVWGSDQLGVEHYIQAGGDTFSITNIPSGTYDLLIEDCEHNVLWWDYQVTASSDLTLTLVDSLNQLVLQNNSSVPICNLYISDSATGDWGRSQLNSENPLPAAATRSFFVEAGTWDLMVETCDGTVVRQMGQRIIDTSTWTLTD